MRRAALVLALTVAGFTAWLVPAPFRSAALMPVMLVAAARFREGEDPRRAEPWRNGGGAPLILPPGVRLRVPALASVTVAGRPRTAGRYRIPLVSVAATLVALAAFLVVATGRWSTCERGWWEPECSSIPQAYGGAAGWLGFLGWTALLAAAAITAVGSLAWSRRAA
jgi:hypothetical protein